VDSRAVLGRHGSATNPLVTVVIPCYNHEKFVGRAIRSVVEQTYSHIQLVVIDDGSRDSSVLCLKRLSKQHEFTLICQANQGVCKTLNRAISEAAQGDYIAVLASDDFWHPDKLTLQMDALREHPDSEFCFTQAVEFTDENEAERGRVFPSKCLTGDVLNKVFLRQHVPAGSMLFSRPLYDRLAGFDESLKEEDWDFVIRSAALTPFVAVDKPLLHYRCHQANTMKTRDRSTIFQQKATILSKNYALVTPWRWLLAITAHFFYDNLFVMLRGK
jgi:alpha-1,3-rhamnosyltransferase